MRKCSLFLFFLSAVVLLSCDSGNKDSDSALKPDKVFEADVFSQTDITYNNARNEFCIASSEGEVYSLDSSFAIIKKTFTDDVSFNSIAYHKSSLILSDSITNRFYRIILPAYQLIDEKFRIIGIGSSKRKEIKALAYIYCDDRWYIFQKKDTLLVNVYDGKFRMMDRKKIINVSGITSACAYNCKLYILGENGTVFRLNNENMKVERSWETSLNNVEGMCFDEKGNLIVLSGSDEKAYVFDNENFD